MKWQNLKDGRCPACGELLREAEGHYRILRCMDLECGFRIREDGLAEILANPKHAANLYPRKFAPPNEEENLTALNNL